MCCLTLAFPTIVHQHSSTKGMFELLMKDLSPGMEGKLHSLSL